MSEQKQKQQQNYDDLMDCLSQHGVDYTVWCRICETVGPCDESIKIFIILLVSKLEGVPDFDDNAYNRLFGHIIRQFTGEDDLLPIECSEVGNLSVEELIETQILEGARYMGIKRLIACLDELRSLGHIEDSEGRLDTTAFAQFVNAYFFLNEVNFNRFIVNLYPDDDTSYPRYLESLMK